MSKLKFPTKEEFNLAAYNQFKNFDDGTTYFKIGEFNGKDMALVIGWSQDYDEGEVYQKRSEAGKLWTLCCKVAFNIDDLQCDYDCDWYMPYEKESGEVFDTDGSYDDNVYDFLCEDAQYIMDRLEEGSLTI